MPDCEFCNHSFNTLGNLTRHQRTVKSCLKIQEERNMTINPYIFECEYCKVNFSSKIKLNYHLNICKEKSERNHIVLLEQKIEQLQLQMNKKYDNKKLIKSSIDCTNNSAPITNNNNNENENSFNTITIINYMTPERVDDTFEKNYTISDLMQHQVGLANFTSEHFLNGTDKPVYLCTDRARHHFTFYNEKNEQIPDENAKTLISLAIQGFEHITETYKTKFIELNQKLKTFAQEEDCEDMVKDIRLEIEKLNDNYAKTMKLEKDGNTYRTQLSHNLPASTKAKKEQDEILLQIEQRKIEYQKKKEEKKLAAAAASSPTSAPTPIDLACRQAMEAYQANPDKEWVMTTNENGQRIVCGVPATKLSLYRSHFRKTNEVKVPSFLDKYPEKMEEYVYWLHEVAL